MHSEFRTLKTLNIQPQNDYFNTNETQPSHEHIYLLNSQPSTFNIPTLALTLSDRCAFCIICSLRKLLFPEPWKRTIVERWTCIAPSNNSVGWHFVTVDFRLLMLLLKMIAISSEPMMKIAVEKLFFLQAPVQWIRLKMVEQFY